jgi:hypothetical protein
LTVSTGDLCSNVNDENTTEETMITRENRSRSTQAAKDFVCISRSLFEHPLWRTQRESTRTEALIDLYRLARSLPTEQLNRGEFQCTYPELADKWGWTRGHAQRFMEAREKDQTIIHLNHQFGLGSFTFGPQPVPEPSPVYSLGLGLVMLAALLGGAPLLRRVRLKC